MIPIRSLNEQWMYIGMPGTGKSWKAREDVWAAATETGGYVVAHDPTDSFDDPGVKVPSRRYRTQGELARGVKKDGGNCVHVLEARNGDDVLRCALALANASMAAAQGNKFRPVYVYWDEAVASSEEASARYLTPLWMDALARRRRYGIAMVMTSQSTYFAHRSVLMMATRVYAFRLSDPEDARRLRSPGLPKHLGETLPRVPDYMFYELVKGRVASMPEYLEPEAPEAPPPSTKAPR